MHEHDLDLVAAYAEGGTSSADAALVDAWISSCAECAGEFTDQQFALASLAAAAPVSMTDLERAGLHRRVREAIAADQLVPTTRVPSTTSSSGRWLRVLTGSAAAILMLVVAFGVIIPSFGGSADMAAPASPAETTMAATAESATSAELQMDQSVASDAASADIMAAPMPVQDLGELTLETLTELAQPLDLESAAAAGYDDGSREAPIANDREGIDGVADAEPVLTCREEGVSILDGEPLWFAVASLDGLSIEVYRSQESLIALATETCALVFPQN